MHSPVHGLSKNLSNIAIFDQSLVPLCFVCPYMYKKTVQNGFFFLHCEFIARSGVKRLWA